MRMHRPRHVDLPLDQRLRANARAYANVYLNRGKIKRLPCAVCGDEHVQIHLNDFTKPLDITWLCAFHNRQARK